jgi:hypothetical protein
MCLFHWCVLEVHDVQRDRSMGGERHSWEGWVSFGSGCVIVIVNDLGQKFRKAVLRRFLCSD